jgi:hypothetical protein
MSTKQPKKETKSKPVKPSKPAKSSKLIKTEVLPNELVLTAGDSKAFTIVDGGIQIRKDLTFEEWRTGLKMFRWAQLNLKIGLADYIKFGQLKYGDEKTSEAITQLEFPLADITKSVDINSVPPSIRQHNLSAEHLVVLARSGKPIKQMETWAATAVKKNLTPAQLKHSIREGRVVDKSVADKHSHGVITIHAIRMEAEVWLNRLGGMEALGGLSDEAKDEIIGELKFFVEIFNKITAPAATESK